ncbi:MAG: leucyl aminopeptidase [Nitrospirota bacterium]
MKISVETGTIKNWRGGGIVVFLLEDDPDKTVASLDTLLAGRVSRLLAQGDFKPTPGAVQILYPEGALGSNRLIIAGLGKESEFTLNKLRQAAGKAAASLRASGADEIALFMPRFLRDAEQTAQAVIEGSMLGLYRFLKYKMNQDHDRAREIRTITLLTEETGSVSALRKGAVTGTIIAEAAMMARDMVNTPPVDMTPLDLAAAARRLAREFDLKLTILDRGKMKKTGMGALVSVAAGSAQPPAFIILEYRGGGKKPPVVLVGKAITFDSGGISIKPSENMDRMKDDMAGGAAVLGTIRTVAALKLPITVVGLVPATENMPSGSAYKPGDVLHTLSGQTIEILSTDAEGRLILADALTYACRYHPTMIIDIATLTGACAIALGNEAIGMLGTDDSLKQLMRTAGEKTGERVWELPLWQEYYEQIKSDIADMKNTGGRAAGVITAAALLSKFVQKYPWLHLDIAALAWIEKEKPYTPKGATGIGVRLLTEFLREYARNTKTA